MLPFHLVSVKYTQHLVTFPDSSINCCDIDFINMAVVLCVALGCTEIVHIAGQSQGKRV